MIRFTKHYNTTHYYLFLIFLLPIYTIAQCPNVPLSIIDGNTGFTIENPTPKDKLGYSVSDAGDINGDGIDDIIIGAHSKDNGSITAAGEAYIIFGNPTFSLSSFDPQTLDGTNGFIVKGNTTDAKLGISVSKAGDVNNDGVDDILIGILKYDASGIGAAMIIYGKRTPFRTVFIPSDIDGNNGIIIKGENTTSSRRDGFGMHVSALGDINGDRIADIGIAAPQYSHSPNTGRYYVIFGNNTLPSILDITTLNGTNGFYIDGTATIWNGPGSTINPAGDINNDGINDIAIGIPRKNEDGIRNRGIAYVIFGKNTSFSSSFNLSSLNGTNGFSILGKPISASLGTTIQEAGDINNDGITDLIVSAPQTEIDGNSSVGEVHIIFGKNTGFNSQFLINNLNGINGMTIIGEKRYDNLGGAAAPAGDFNNDGIDDIIIGSIRASRSLSGGAYVVFGKSSPWDPTFKLETINGTNAILLLDDRRYVYTNTGFDVSTAGDVNNDGVSDILIGSNTRDYDAGTAYVIHGDNINYTDTTLPTINCPTSESLYLNATIPNYMFHIDLGDNCTYHMDLMYRQTPPQGTIFTGTTTVTMTVTDKAGNSNSCSFPITVKPPPPSLSCTDTYITTDNLNGVNGFSIIGELSGGNLGHDVRKAGDINGDGIADFIVGAPGEYYSFSGPYRNESYNVEGKVYVVFGTRSGFPSHVNVALLDGTDGFRITNDTPISQWPETGYQVSTAGDINNDGIDDIMMSDPFRSTSLGRELGHVYFVFGKTSGFPPVLNLSSLDGTNGFTFISDKEFDQSARSIDHIGDINHDGISDIIIGAGTSGGAHKGRCFILYGSTSTFPDVLRSTDLDGNNGFIIEGDADGDRIGSQVTGLGDINGDGISDIGFSGGTTKKTFVLFGKNGNLPHPLTTSSINGSNGFYVDLSLAPSSTSGTINSVGDINGDGINDILFGGKWLLFGKNTGYSLAEDIYSLNGINGFSFSVSGFSDISSAGDFNNDGITDLLLGRIRTSTVILFGRSTGWSPTINPYVLDNSQAFQVRSPSSYTGASVDGIGDINMDGFDDILLGSPTPSYSASLTENPGYAYVLFGFSLTDTEKPVITCPSNQVLASGNTLPDYTSLVSVVDNCDSAPEITQTPGVGSPYTSGMTVTMIATDASGNRVSCTFIVSDITDTTPPSITCPTDQTVSCTTTTVPDYSSLVSATDAIDPNPTINQTPSAGSPLTDGMTITMEATDASGNSNSCSFVIRLMTDTTPPNISCIADQVLTIGDNIPDYSSMHTATDDCDPNPTINQTPPPGTPFTDGMTITMEATDLSGNNNSCSFIIHQDADTTPPSITCPTDQTVSCTTTIVPDYSSLVSATDAIDPNPTINQTPSAGSPLTDGMTITMEATDASGNSNSCSFVIRLMTDTTPPNISCIADQVLTIGDNIPDYSSMHTATDDCDPNPTINQTPPPGTPFTDGMTITMEATDLSGNNNSCSFIIHQDADTTPPSITCPTDQTVSCTTTIVPDYSSLVNATDVIDPNPIINQTPSAGSPLTDGMTITITATDVSGNISSCSFRVNTPSIEVDAGSDEYIEEGESIQLEIISSEEGTFSWTPATGLDNPESATPIATPAATTTYTVTFYNRDRNCFATDEVTIHVYHDTTHDTRYGFSPDNDGINDFWEIKKIEEYPENVVSIYNRWGDLVFEIDGYDNKHRVFNGMANRLQNLGASKLPEGTYFFIISIKGTHTLKKTKGYLILKR
ncbi:HYR domain-containing protein [Aquimarina hainanensis]